ncbi:MAG: NlpC/P60 family protein [Pseudonocardiales bacterium]|nr:C40 family peptidase [Pseudonocardiales bacterium]PZS22432.1 MAG: NlpC/P60 family protein [Pseudonocardiales bacterium]
MRRWLVGLLVIGVLGGLIALAAISTLLGGVGSGDFMFGAPCGSVLATTDPREAPRVAVRVSDLDAEQRAIVEQIIAIGKQRRLPPRAWQIAIQAGMTESRLHNLPYGDRDSLGIFQMRPSQGWGSVAQVTDPVYEINKFYDKLLMVPGWENQRPGDSAQAIERSAFPARYHQWEPLAVNVIGTVGGDVTEYVKASCTTPLPAPSEVAGRAIQYALGEVGKPYVWGATGPNAYDCSGLMLRSYQSAGVTLPRVAAQQYWAGTQLPVRQAQPGDLLFWGYDTSNPDTIHHVAMYLGNGRMVEAANQTVPLRQRAVNFDEHELMPLAVRPGVPVAKA